MARKPIPPRPQLAPEEAARQKLAEPFDLNEIAHQQMWGGKPPEINKPVPGNDRRLTDRQRHLIRQLMDPNVACGRR